MGSQRSESGDDRLARWAELTTRTEWNLNPTGRGWIFRTGQQKGREHFAITEPQMDPGGDFFEQALTGRFLEQPHQGLNLRAEPDHAWRHRSLGSRHTRQAVKQTQITKTKTGRGNGGGFQELTPVRQHNEGFS